MPRLVGLDRGKRPQRTAEVPQRDLLAQADDGAAIFPEADRGDEVGHIPGLMIKVPRVEAMDPAADDVDPDQPAGAVVPDKALADDVSRIEDNLGSRRGHVSSCGNEE